ncbi:MAG: Transcriptional regulator, TetR family [Chloroflexi bacterium]|nr:Transcriptional regulator, TetR family [Chloroflexota bacterium]
MLLAPLPSTPRHILRSLKWVVRAMQQAGAVLLERARAAGEVRPGSSVAEVLRLVYGIGLANDHAGDLDDAEKMFDIVIAGIAT